MKKTTLLALSALSLSACGTVNKISNIGQSPNMSPIENPVTKTTYQPVSLPMPHPQESRKENNSLWVANKTTFFQDQRASDIGDIITVLIDIDDEAALDNETSRTRASGEGASLPALAGLEASLGEILPEAVSNTDLISANSTSSSSGAGTVEREEEIKIRIAGLITQILPNGNMVIHGRQEVLVNYEKRILQIDGVIRPEDITTSNTIAYDQIAEARIVYGGEGQIMDAQQPRYGQQLYDIIFPF